MEYLRKGGGGWELRGREGKKEDNFRRGREDFTRLSSAKSLSKDWGERRRTEEIPARPPGFRAGPSPLTLHLLLLDPPVDLPDVRGHLDVRHQLGAAEQQFSQFLETRNLQC